LVEFDAPMADLTVHDLTQPNVVFQFGMPPIRVDVMTTIKGVEFDAAWKNRVEIHLDDISVPVIGLEDLVRKKETAKRDSDRLHVARLRRYGKSDA
jgi:hypothetical protein